MHIARDVLIPPFRSLDPVFLPKRHTKWSFLATVSLATLHQHLSLLKNKVMHNSIPKWLLFDHIDHKMTGFHICKCLALCIPFGYPYGCPFQRTYTIDCIQYNIRSFPYHPHYLPHAMQVMHAYAMLRMLLMLIMLMQCYSHTPPTYCKQKPIQLLKQD